MASVESGPLTISAVLPAYNEDENLESTVSALAPVLRRVTSDYEILIINDGSSDRTMDVATRLGLGNPEIQVLSHRHNLGYGAALRTGFNAARYEWTLLVDADGQFLPEEVERLVRVAPKADMVPGYREHRVDPLYRRSYAATWRLLMRAVLGVHVRDINCGFKLMRTSMVKSLELEASGALISAELLAKARRRRARIVEVPVTHVSRRFGRQTGGDPRVLLRAYYELGCLWWRIRRFPSVPRVTDISEVSQILTRTRDIGGHH